MKHIEDKLRNAALTPSPESLDHAIEQMLRWAQGEDATRRRRRQPFWFAFVGCVAGLLLGVVVSPLLRGGSEIPGPAGATVVIVEPTPQLERWVTTGKAKPRGGFFERQHGELEAVFVAGSTQRFVPKNS
jgi:hypothetical protein